MISVVTESGNLVLNSTRVAASKTRRSMAWYLRGVVMAAVVATTAANFQFTDNSWTRLAYCNTRRSSALEYPLATVAQMAQASTQVKICTYGSTVDCVTSAPNSFPIQQLAAGRLQISSDYGVETCCSNETCLRSTWSGPATRVNELIFSCTGGCSDRITPGMVYHACGNPAGMHFSVNNQSTTGGPTGYCSWGGSTLGFGSGWGRLELFINFPVSSAPTTPTPAPSAAPSGWWQVPTVPNDLSTMYSRLQSVESQVLGMSSLVASQISTTNSNLQQQGNQLTAAVTSVAVTADTLSAAQTALASNITAITSALRAAVQSAAVGGGGSQVPTITASNNQMTITAGAAVRLVAGTCSNSDLCGAASFASTLQQAIQSIPNL